MPRQSVFSWLAPLLNNSNKFGDTVDKDIKINDIDSFSVYDGAILSDNYVISVYQINEPSEYLVKIMNIAKEFGEMGIQEKFDALGNVNLINYHRINDNSNKKK